MPPERFRGWSDPRSDTYSLGLTLYEMLALRPAFAECDQARLIHDIANVDPRGCATSSAACRATWRRS